MNCRLTSYLPSTGTLGPCTGPVAHLIELSLPRGHQYKYVACCQAHREEIESRKIIFKIDDKHAAPSRIVRNLTQEEYESLSVLNQ